MIEILILLINLPLLLLIQQIKPIMKYTLIQFNTRVCYVE